MKNELQLGRFSVLVVGAGSIGQRHLRNLRMLGVQNLAACDPNAERLACIAKTLGVKSFNDFENALSDARPDVIFICTPPIYHVAQAKEAVKAGADVFIEKPLSNRLEGIDQLIAESEARRRVVQVGYNLRFSSGLQKIKQLLKENVIGRILWARAEVGQYLPDWRPQQDYRESYSARSELGGGIILDASHELDYIIWLLGSPSEIACLAGRVSKLEVDVEDCATILLSFSDGAQADVHMDFVQRSYSRSCKLVGEKGTLIWVEPQNQVQLYQADGDNWQTMCYSAEVNQMYVEEVKHFLACVSRKEVSGVDLQQARKTLEVALAARRAAEGKRWVRIG